jgi:hypothetical protein
MSQNSAAFQALATQPQAVQMFARNASAFSALGRDAAFQALVTNASFAAATRSADFANAINQGASFSAAMNNRGN